MEIYKFTGILRFRNLLWASLMERGNLNHIYGDERKTLHLVRKEIPRAFQELHNLVEGSKLNRRATKLAADEINTIHELFVELALNEDTGFRKLFVLLQRLHKTFAEAEVRIRRLPSTHPLHHQLLTELHAARQVVHENFVKLMDSVDKELRDEYKDLLNIINDIHKLDHNTLMTKVRSLIKTDEVDVLQQVINRRRLSVLRQELSRAFREISNLERECASVLRTLDTLSKKGIHEKEVESEHRRYTLSLHEIRDNAEKLARDDARKAFFTQYELVKMDILFFLLVDNHLKKLHQENEEFVRAGHEPASMLAELEVYLKSPKGKMDTAAHSIATILRNLVRDAEHDLDLAKAA
ncbi:hypothetical protein HYW21_08195 [Candidatus Woesearchaeota archaeon]|nr:hypothetical protein [Candidatus Woesearchaeota archaeon]